MAFSFKKNNILSPFLTALNSSQNLWSLERTKQKWLCKSVHKTRYVTGDLLNFEQDTKLCSEAKVSLVPGHFWQGNSVIIFFLRVLSSH